jgi:hypothetical protein
MLAAPDGGNATRPSRTQQREAHMSLTENGAQETEPDRTKRINAIVEVMRASWDTPADCNDGELFTYAEVLYDKIEAGEDRAALDAYLADVQTDKLGMPASEAHREIVERATGGSGKAA